MIPELKGKIIEGKYKETVSNSQKILGPAWLSVADRNYLTNKTQAFNTDGRMICIPGADETFTGFLCILIENAKECVVLSSYLLQEGAVTDALLKRADEGIPIYILTARSEDLIKCRDSDEINVYDEQQREFNKRVNEHKNLLDKLAGKVLVRTASHFHAKFLLCDPLSENPNGVMMTCNATVDALKGNNIEFALQLSKEETRSFFALFLQGFWNESDNELLEPGKLHSVRNTPALVNSINFGVVDVPVTFKDKVTLRDEVITLIRDAKEEIDLGCWTLSEKDVLDLLCKKAKEGVKVRTYLRTSIYNSDIALQLVKAGVEVFGHQRLHAKFVIADKKHGIVMTANISPLGMDEGFEGGVKLRDDETKTAENIINIISSLCTLQFFENAKVADITHAEGNKSFQDNKIYPIEVIDNRTEEREISVINYMIHIPVQYPALERKYNAKDRYDYIEVARETILNLSFKPDKLPDASLLEGEACDVEGVKLYTRKDVKNKKYAQIENWEDVEKAEQYLNANYTLVI